MRVVIDFPQGCQRQLHPEQSVQLTRCSPLFGLKMLAIEKGIPKVLGLKQIGPLSEHQKSHPQKNRNRQTESGARAQILPDRIA
jgi:DNA gyrase/topoisomerase IV subunit A